MCEGIKELMRQLKNQKVKVQHKKLSEMNPELKSIFTKEIDVHFQSVLEAERLRLLTDFQDQEYKNRIKEPPSRERLGKS